MPSLPHAFSFLEFLYPPSCAACDRALSSPRGLCDVCLVSCEDIVQSCPTCAAPIAGPRRIQCSVCLRYNRGTYRLDSALAAYEYGGQLAVALKRLKFANRSDVARTLRPLLQESFAAVATKVDCAISIPLHPKRLRKRGYNQSQRILVALAQSQNLPVFRNALWRVRDTKNQASLGATKRRENVNKAFRGSRRVRGKRILLLDDVCTTGHTLRAGARALRRAGAREIHAFVVARAPTVAK